MDTPRASHSLKLTSVSWRDGKPMGFGLRVRANGGAEVHLLIDTGAHGVMVSQRAARKMRLEESGSSLVEGFGSGLRAARSAVAAHVQAGTLTLHNVPVGIFRDPLVPDVEGVLGVDVFSDFLIRIDGPKRVLELTAFVEGEAKREGLYPFHQAGHLILVDVRVNRRHEGQFLLDSGAFCSVVDPAWSPQTAVSAGVRGIGGTVGTFARTLPVELELAGRSSWESEVVAMDLKTLRQKHGVPITGLIGYPAMARSVLTLDLRDKRLRFSDR